MALSVHNVEKCLMTPPRQRESNALQWTPTANLKLLLKAASPDLRSREVLHSQQNSSDEVFWSLSQSSATVTAPNNCSMHSDASVTNTDICAATLVGDKQRRKDKSLGLLCGRYLTLHCFSVV